MIIALDTEGIVWFTLSHANTDSNMMGLFLYSLVNQLERESPGWKEDTIILLDNASYHVSVETRVVV